MTEKEKMTAGKIYDPSDEELVKLRTKAHRLSKEYNELLETDEKRSEILKEMGIIGDSFYLQGPVQFDYGCLTSIGANSYANFNFTCVDCYPVTIGANVFMGPNVSLLTPMHPLRWQDRRKCYNLWWCYDRRGLCDRCWKRRYQRYSGKFTCSWCSMPRDPRDYGRRCAGKSPGVVLKKISYNQNL